MSLPMDMGGNDLYVNNIYTANTGPGQLTKGGDTNTSTTLTANTTLTNAQNGSVFVLDALAGLTVTLPTPIVGTSYTFVVGAVTTSNKYKIVTGTIASQFIAGGLFFDKALAITRYDADGSTDVSINLNGTTTGGAAIGDTFTLTAVSPTIWAVSGTVQASGTLATPFATT